MEYLFDDVFLVKDVDHDGKKFDKGIGAYFEILQLLIFWQVSRIECRSEHYDMDLILDVATDIYPMKAEDRFHCVLSSTLSTSTATPSSLSTNGPSSNVLSGGGTSLADRFDYVMHGKIYKAEEAQRTGLISSSGGGKTRTKNNLIFTSCCFLI